MYARRWNRLKVWIASLTSGSVFLLGDCDPTIRSTVEDGIISVSTGLLSAFGQAIFQVFAEASAAASA